jgi:alpha-L-fucosidase 2
MNHQNTSRRDFLRTAGAVTSALALHGCGGRTAGGNSELLNLWYDAPASNWNEALPIGNGRLGAMVFSGVEQEHLQLNEDTLYGGEPGQRDLPLDITKDFDRIAKMVREGNYVEAEEFITKNWIGRVQPCYQPLGDIYLDFDGGSAAENYRRELDISQAVQRTTYRQDGVTHSREIFASHPDEVIVVRLSADQPGSLNCRVRLSSVHPTAKTEVADGTLIMTGQVPGFTLRRELNWIESKGVQWKYPEIFNQDGSRKPVCKQLLYADEIDRKGTYFEARLGVRISGGEAAAEDGAIAIRNADEVLLVMSADSSYNGFEKSPSREGVDPSVQASRDLENASGKNFAQLRNDHVEDYRSQFDRASLTLGQASPQSNLPTDERIREFHNDQDQTLAALYLQFGRYLTIAGSREGTQPLNLQGIWNEDTVPAWAGAYTMNINVETNYFPTEMLNLSECHEPMLRFIKELAADGAGVAKNMYGRRGWVAHHNTTIWRSAQPVDNLAHFSFWPMAQGWLSQHLWQHYLFTGDREFLLSDGYPLMKGAAEFYLDWMVEDADGYLTTPISVTPENRFFYTDKSGKKQEAGVSMGTTMDHAIMRETFRHCIEAAELLELDAGFRAELREKMARIAPYEIGTQGQLLEWPEEFEERDPEHRHLSHLYGLHPGNDITRDTPEMLEAAKQSLLIRGDEGTGWSRGWKINMWARLGDGDHAYQLAKNLIRPARMEDGRPRSGGTLPNMLCSCPPFNIDGNFSGPAGLAEMLLQSHAGAVELLPALPGVWPDGQMRGFCARGGFEVDVDWAAGKLVTATIRSKLGKLCRVRYRDRTVEFETQTGGTYGIDESLRAGPRLGSP